MADDPAEPEPAQLDADPTEVDTEERRRLGNQRRRFVRRQERRRGFLAKVAEEDPELHEELLWWRRHNPQEFRQRLVRWAVRHGHYPHRRYTSRDHPADLMERYGYTWADDEGGYVPDDEE